MCENNISIKSTMYAEYIKFTKTNSLLEREWKYEKEDNKNIKTYGKWILAYLYHVTEFFYTAKLWNFVELYAILWVDVVVG